MFTTQRLENNGQISSVVRFHSIKQARDWADQNGHILVTGYAAKKALSSGAVVRIMRNDGRVGF